MSNGTYARVAPSAYKIAAALRLQSRQPGMVVRHVELPLGLGRRFALLADIHADHQFMHAAQVARIVDETNEHGPFDAVLVPGDFAGHDPSALIGPARALGSFDAPVFFTNGNHDHSLGAARVALALRNSGVEVLDNEAVPLDGFGPPIDPSNPGSSPWIAGIDSMAGDPRPDLALAEVPAGAPVIVVGHEPKLATMHSEILHVAGHTHHGQVRVPGMPPIFRPRHSDPYPAGLYEVEVEATDSGRGGRGGGSNAGRRGGDGSGSGSTGTGDGAPSSRWIYTTAGIGTTTFPLRVSCPPEVVVIDC